MKRYKLGELVDVTRGMSLPGEFYSTKGDLIRLTLGNFDYSRGGFKINTSKDNIYYTGEVRDEFILKKGDIITPLTEQTPGLLGTTARIPVSGKYVQSQDIALIKCKQGKIAPSFCFYLISSSSVKKQLGDAAQQTKIRHTSPDRIKDVIVDIPSIEEQEKIGRVLDAVTAKIDKLDTISEILEALARQIYDYWFIQYDFPDENGKPYKYSGGRMVWNEKLNREIPDGWNSACVGELIEPLQRGISYRSEDISSENGVPFFNLACFNKKGEYRSGEMKFYSGRYSDSDKIYPFDMLVACTDMTQGADIIGRPILATKESDYFLYTMDLAKITPSLVEKMYLYYTLKTPFYHHYIKPFASGTNVKHLDTRGILDYIMVVPPKKYQDRFESIIYPIKQLQMEVLNETFSLTNYRTTILPILLNGQICVR